MESKNELNSFLEAKLALLKSYDLLTEKIQESFRKRDLENVHIPLSRREEIARKIEKLDSSLRERILVWENGKSETEAKFRGVVEGFYRKIRNVLEQITLKEKDLIPILRGKSEELKREIIRIRETRHGVGSYHRPNPSFPRFLDARK
jgi:polyphosphate kinase